MFQDDFPLAPESGRRSPVLGAIPARPCCPLPPSSACCAHATRLSSKRQRQRLEGLCASLIAKVIDEFTNRYDFRAYLRLTPRGGYHNATTISLHLVRVRDISSTTVKASYKPVSTSLYENSKAKIAFLRR